MKRVIVKQVSSWVFGVLVAFAGKIQGENREVNTNPEYVDYVTERFVSYARVNSQSMEATPTNSFPITDGQRTVAKMVEEELREICKGKEVEIVRSESEYVYVKIPTNMKKMVPSLMFMAHLDVTPEAPGGNITPIVHTNYQGGTIVLPAGITLNPDMIQGRHLKNCIGKTIITSDGSTLLGADDKAGCTIMLNTIEAIVNDKTLKHGDLYFVFSQNEDVGLAADRLESKYIGNPDMVIDIDGGNKNVFSIANFTAVRQYFRFIGNNVHPSEGKKDRYADALTAAGYFLGMIPPEKHPSASEGKQGYLHCYVAVHPTDSTGREVLTDYELRFRLRYFDKAEGDTLRQILSHAVEKTRAAYPFVKVEVDSEVLQYENIAYSMHPEVLNVVAECGREMGWELTPMTVRGGTTSSMMVAKGLRGGPNIYSGQQAEHSVYEWTCVEDMIEMTQMSLQIVKKVARLK